MYKTLPLILFFSLFICSCRAQPQSHTFTPVAVIELFTSEGCSSCPPADKLLARYSHEDTYQGVKVFTLAFHVDYWNYLGWRDSFSSAANTERQKMYVEALGLSGAYTPQMIVNGEKQFVGSDEAALQSALTAVAHDRPEISFTRLDIKNMAQGLKVEYALSGITKNCSIHFALVSLEVSTAVRRGENVGRKLSHTNVVRQFETQKASASGEVIFNNPVFSAAGNTAMIAYVQSDASHRIVAAAEVE